MDETVSGGIISDVKFCKEIGNLICPLNTKETKFNVVMIN